MRIALSALSLSLVLAFTAPAQAALDMPPGIAWRAASQDADIEAAFQAAKAEKKPVLLYWGAKWCPPCNQLKATLFNRADFIEQSHAVIPVLIDGDLPGAQKLGARFKVRGYPTMILFNGDGQELTRLPGEADAARVVKLFQMGLSGGRPIKAVLADAQAGKPLKAGEWQLLSFYSWETDEQSLVGAADRGAVLQRLAQGRGVPDEARTRLKLKSLAAGANPAQGDAAWVGSLLGDAKKVRQHLDVLSNSADDLVRALHPKAGADRITLVHAFQQALLQQQNDTQLSRADRINCLAARVELARLDLDKADISPKLEATLLNEVRGLTALLDREIQDGYERQAVMTAAGHVLGLAGLWSESDALLKANLSKSHSPYYLMNQLGANARKTGRKDEALSWFEQAFNKSEGPATRLQWGATYFENLVKLAPQDAARIEKLAAQLVQEAEKDKGAFYERSARSLQKVSEQLLGWAKAHNGQAAVARVQGQLGPVCGKLDKADASRSTCEALFKPRA
ncbi:thioredoxin family protein [Inhella gelatinilytica]|uniref:Thioredoxin fold domain-containing protein n=1 Tax=Inhella gelatinilytica TaxID=2795030 RepID=A0A931IW72_9BURK|nr:thioredoxin fold domain-containing protein [Inhella gelatinilytica]MBH9552149.1 thioredoxin fold domain-containing protein [Inhella gelatinilytica]